MVMLKPPFGMEFRIFDHFPSDYLLDLMKIIVLVAANSDRHPPKNMFITMMLGLKVLGLTEYGWNAKIKY